MRRAKPRKGDAVPERRRFLEKPAARLKPASPPAGLHHGAGVAFVGVPAVGGVTAALLVRRLRAPLAPAEPRLGLAEIDGGGRAGARPPLQPGELRYAASAAA